MRYEGQFISARLWSQGLATAKLCHKVPGTFLYGNDKDIITDTDNRKDNDDNDSMNSDNYANTGYDKNFISDNYKHNDNDGKCK